MRTLRGVVISDVHRPFHDKVLWSKVCKFVGEFKPDILVNNGDWMDMYSLGSYNADSVRKLQTISLSYEYKDANEGLSDLDAVTPATTRKVFMYGNHEDRYWREVDRGDRGKYGDALKSPTEALKLIERGYEVHDNWKQDFIKIGNRLEILHGLYTSVHVAKKHLDELQGSAIVGHSHRYNTFSIGQRTVWNIGFLGDMANPGFHYKPRSQREKWTQGFSVFHIDDNGDEFVEPVVIRGQRFVYGGKMY